MLTKGVVLLRDNTRTHTAARTRGLIKLFNWEIFDHPLCSPDLAPSDYRLFTKINPLSPELNPICYLLALLGAHHFFHVSRIRVKLLTFR